MPKLTEKQLYAIWLDIHYANGLNDDYISDMEMQLKDARKARTKIRRLLVKAAEHYQKVYGKLPKIYKK